MKRFYVYSELNGAFLYHYDAQESPLEPGQYIAPTFSTDIEPTRTHGEWPVWNGSSWSSVQDHRGPVWHKVTGDMVVHDEIGPLPAELTIIEKPGEFYIWSNLAVAWVDDIGALKSEKIRKLKSSCELAIVAGISSSVLGSPHTYPTELTDQGNLNGLVTESLMSGSGDEYKFWCANSGGAWARRTHTKVQIQSLGLEVAAHVKACQAMYENRLIALTAASTRAEIEAVVWQEIA